MKKLLLFTLIFTVNFSARAERQCMDLFRKQETTVAESFRRLGADYQELQYQASQALVDARYVVPHGGLCATTCAVNLIHAYYEFNGMGAHFDSLAMSKRVLEYAYHFGIDARYGMNALLLSDFLSHFGDYEQRFPFHVTLISSPYITANAMHVAPKALHIVTVKFPDAYHAMVVLRFDSRTGEIDLGDPNHPDVVTRTSFQWVKDAAGLERIKINWDVDNENTGLVEDLIITEMSYKDFL